MNGWKSAVGILRLGWIGRERVVAYSIILAFVSLLSFGWIYFQATGKGGSDFLAFWSAGRLVDTGAASSVYDTRATFAVRAQVGRQDVFAFVNPPPFLFAVAPFGLLPYPLAWALWIGVTYAIWLLVSRRLDKSLSWPIAAFPGTLVAGWHAQTGLLLSAFQAGAAQLLRKRPFAAGLCVGAPIAKPHLAILFPVAFAAGWHWKAFADTHPASDRVGRPCRQGGASRFDR